LNRINAIVLRECKRAFLACHAAPRVVIVKEACAFRTIVP
jgi:hypothetical protein